MDIEYGNGKNMLYRYLSPSVMKKKHIDHPDPLFDELTYGEGGNFSSMVRQNVLPGSHIFFHTTIGGQRYITAHYFVSKIMEGFDARQDKDTRATYRNVHIHPENFEEWWPSYDVNLEKETDSNDIVIFGDKKSLLGNLRIHYLLIKNSLKN
ncbi:hypothetical protein RE474_05315 [Methanolobus sediminis]|uniref:Nucleotide modification associated domain-containing protein n=1 Tax=Methanolobus sediminis TaxID=3072978 RepID=A0AA51YK25_9EURY|nr:hypothetical protein [Methanolobus sediminis]WMW26140.1 hypothetical protein RE474_05315 [Methanolobus sediminis]